MAVLLLAGDELTGIQFDALALVNKSKTVEQVYDTLLEAITKNIKLIEATVTNEHRNLQTFVFFPNEIGHFISYVYPQKPIDDGKTDIWTRLVTAHLFCLRFQFSFQTKIK